MAMFMFGLFSFTVPLNVSQDTEKKDQGSLAHSIGMGFFAAILSTPCSFGILAAVFGWAQGQTLFISTTVIMLIGVGMASPFFVLTLMPGLLSKLPRSGGWMERIKEGIGFLLLIIAVWLLLALPADLRANAFYYAVLLCLCVWIWGKWTKYGDKPLKRWSVRLFAVALAVVAGLYLFSSPEKKMNWQPYDAQAINKAVENHRPVLIKFTADWCLSCKVVEKLVYQDTELIELIEAKNVLAVKADTTLRDYEATLALKNIYNEPGVPVSILILADGTEKRWRGKGFADDLKDLLSDL
jgi:thiol:disulfide interchange protein DsbD